ncbi:uncharacterized protein LOC125865429 [Solanum stenotomum]|uniref:uncharacterized protein LOC125865429 n=1 Tax=Solanum stenotomum TaxID=172797 RepID=UPI0020D1CE21|nr:uncharacterized protein LOC125865429 [Solanum stenotomum]
MNDSIRITRGIPHNIQNFGDFPSFDLCITQGLLENVGSAARMAQESSSKKKRVLWSETPDDQGKDRSDEVLLSVDEEASEFYVKDQPTKAPHIQCVFNNGIKADLIRNLHEHVYNVFRESTCFGNYMQMHGCCARGQIHRCCMALELNCSSCRAFVMRVNGSTLRFTLREFALISGLNCVSEEKDFIFDTTEPNRLMEQYFQGVKLIRKVDIMESFEAKVWGDNDQDGLKFAILFFIQTVIFSGERVTKKVPRLHFDLVESGTYSQFPWGKKSFYLLMKSLSKKMDSEKQFYRIGGMPIVIQVWLYECSSSIDFQVAQKVDDHIPRLLNWQTAKEIPRYKKLMKTIFNDVNNKVYYLHTLVTLTFWDT